ncbi:MAG: ZIP family metal transporter [Treponema sp.]|nr:ZIP family metal transporter [Treponema sp.]
MAAVYGILIPFVGTTLGALCVFLLQRDISAGVQRLMYGFTSGVMVAASVWSLIMPALSAAVPMGRLAFIPAAVGIALGMAFLFVLDVVTPHLHVDATGPEGPESRLSKTVMLCLAVTIHNIPEGLAVGVVFAGVAHGTINAAEAFVLSLGIAIQNFPEGAIISLPLAGEGNGKSKSFLYGFLSGVVEPIAAVIAFFLTGLVVPLMPYLLSFAAGAMLFVVVEELIPEASDRRHSNNGTVGFAIGFIVMMALDVALG